MKKLLICILVCFTTCAVQAMPPRRSGPPIEIDLNTSGFIAGYISSTLYPSYWAPTPLTPLVLLIPSGGYTYMPSAGASGSLYGTNTYGQVGFGVSASFSNGVVTFTTSEFGFGIGWAYELANINGKDVIVLKIAISVPLLSTTSTIILTPEMLGLDAYTAALNLLTGKYDEAAVKRLVDGSRLMYGEGSGSWVSDFYAWKVTLADTVFLD